ncbi:hypothetical protein [Geminicoccus sp.]|uniref:hypothetical protein n=1 Tax=Geminicoccus sp. TaxID=2024832 RepID=UPI002D7E7993|nr:hypothetical protein [Geminicoccus sp.]
MRAAEREVTLSMQLISVKLGTSQPDMVMRDLPGMPLPWPHRVISQQLGSRRDWALSSSSNQSRAASSKTFPARSDKERSAIDVDYDRWLNRRMHQLYDPVLDEAIPPEMAKLLLQFEEKPQDGEDEK